MAFGGFRQDGPGRPMAEINMIPLIDVMLVLLVIFIITTPLLTHSVKIDLPKATSHPNLTQPDNVQLGIDAQGTVYWNGEVIGMDDMRVRMASAAKLNPQPELHIRADRTTQYQVLAEVMAEASKAGLVKIGFVSDPKVLPQGP
jgi:biopolymer transport protein ExbD